jgi:phosphoribosyl-ATP pyrophosphohydrolase
MAQVLHSIESEPDHTVEIVVHITETLGEQRREDLVAALEDSSGITTAEFCPLRYHLMLVRYDRDLYSSQDVLKRVTSQNVNARLIGPV